MEASESEQMLYAHVNVALSLLESIVYCMQGTKYYPNINDNDIYLSLKSSILSVKDLVKRMKLALEEE